jgi:hypothetical protein
MRFLLLSCAHGLGHRVEIRFSTMLSTTLLRQYRTHGLKFAMTHVPVSHANEATEVTVRAASSDTDLWAGLIRWQHNQAVMRTRSEEIKEGHLGLKANLVLSGG